MTNRRLLRPSSRRLALLLLAVAVPPAATLVWLGLQLLQQDRELLTQRDFERRQTAVQAVARALGQAVAQAERRASEGSLPEGMVRLLFSADGIDAAPRDRVLLASRRALVAARRPHAVRGRGTA